MSNIVTKGLSKILVLAGLGLIIVSLIWWQQTFGLDLDRIKCLVVSDGICKISKLKNLFGGTAYNPLIFWAGLVSLIVGLVLNRK